MKVWDQVEEMMKLIEDAENGLEGVVFIAEKDPDGRVISFTGIQRKEKISSWVDLFLPILALLVKHPMHLSDQGKEKELEEFINGFADYAIEAIGKKEEVQHDAG